MRKLKSFSIAIGFIFIFYYSLWGKVSIPAAGLNAISPDTIYAHVAFLASDRMKGRNTPSPELDSCAHFIANYFKQCGLTSPSNAENYFQTVPLLRTRLDGKENQRFILSINGTKTIPQIKNDFVPLHLSANREITAPVVFVGFGITAPEYHYDDYIAIDVKGKIVMAFSHEPQEKDTTSVFNGAKPTEHSKLINKVLNAIDHGAVGFIYVTNPGHRFRRPPNYWQSLLKRQPRGAIPLTLGEKQENKIVAVRVGKKLAESLFSVSEKTMKEIYQEINVSFRPQSFELKGVKVSLMTRLSYEQLSTQNVVGFWEGSDPQFKNEIIVIGAHYDHLGAKNDSIIYNGADDNASGTAGVLAVAKAFSCSPFRPKRSILFITFAGEEKGLFGSRYYVGTEPLFPLKNTIAMINLDMIGRNDTSAVKIYGADSSPELKETFLNVNQTVKLHYTFASLKKLRGSSDHQFFRKNEIPYLFFFTGLHQDYHKPTDTVDKILPQKIANIVKAVFGVTWLIGNSEKRPQFIKK